MGALWKEIKNWRQSEHWSTRKFFQAFVLGLVLTLLDTGTDLAFAESIPDTCPKTRIGNQNHCDHFVSKGVKYCAYTLIALPGIMLSFSALHSLVRKLWHRMCGSEVQRCFGAPVNAVALFLQVVLCTGLIYVPVTGFPVYTHWTHHIIEGYETTIKAIAYSSAGFLIGVKLLGTICHGPEVTRLVDKLADAGAFL